MEEKIVEVYAQVEQYAKEKELSSVIRALPIIRDIMSKNNQRYNQELYHCLEVCMMLIDLYISISPEEEDMLLSAVILHIYPENFFVNDLENKIIQEFGFPHAIYEIIDTIIPHKNLTDEERRLFYKRAQENKLALLAMLADRGNIVQQLYRYSTWDAHRYIDETKACYYPMCIYGKEHYHELLAPISVLMEKMRSLIEVTEILLRKYEVREAELIQDILALREENATIRGIIKKFKG